MEWIELNKEELALFFVRSVLGVLFVFQGYDKLFGVGISAATNAIADAMNMNIPKSFVRFSVGISSTVELVGGALLLFGLWTYPIVAILGLHIVLVTTAMSYREALWDMRFVFPRLMLIILIMLLPASWNVFSLDTILVAMINTD